MHKKTKNTKSSRLTFNNRNLLVYDLMVEANRRLPLFMFSFILSLHHACRVCKYMVAVYFDFYTVSDFDNDK